MAKSKKLLPRNNGTGTLVGVRVQPPLMKRLDKARGKQTRPEKIREVMDRSLPKG